jgi:peptide/nickel transport system substrate-binding protein
MSNPASNPALRGNGTGGWFGWPDAPKLEALRDQWLSEADPVRQRQIAAAIQRQAFIDVPFLPLGEFLQPTVQKDNLTGTLRGLSLFWNVRRT